jgi:DNA-binding NtrC family response regulator
MRTVLVIDDNPAVTEALEVLFALHDIGVTRASSPEEGLRRLEETPTDLVIADMNFSADTTSGEEGVELFRAIRKSYPDLPVILLTAWTSLESAVRLVKAGAADYLAKPWDNDRLLATVENLLEFAESARTCESLRRERRRRQADLERKYDLRGAVFASEAMGHTLELACRVARANVSVLITGPNGAGKERVAQILHANSGLSGQFVAVNCGAIPPGLVEAELFGVEAGAYTSADRAREGRFETAEEGTLFLDEIGQLPLSCQVKLLRVLETKEFARLGSSRTRTANVRVVSATNADLPSMIRNGRFREDLFYRLNVIQIEVPALAERPDDIMALAEHFLGPAGRFADDARAALLAHAWPGNVRELRNAVERAKLLSVEGVITQADLGLPAARRQPRDLEEPGRDTLEQALRAAKGNVSRAAQRLGMSRQALYRRLERAGLRPEE